MKKFRIAIFASGNGTNAERFFTHFRGHPQIEVVLLLCNKADAFVLERARNANIKSEVFDKAQFISGEVLKILEENSITHVVLAGFLWLIPSHITAAFPNRVINIHPALLPKFGGKGMYGSKVHEAVKDSGDQETGITIHLVNERYDEGKVIFQARTNVEESDSPEDIAAKVHALEYDHYPKVVEDWILKAE
ncbi:MAG: phosphoribosylglycinamide formyltransferase [Cyclobacteriaceae bacterium]